MKYPLIGFCLLLLNSCSLFVTTPEGVVEGQRGVYQGVLIAEENTRAILLRYEEDNKAAVTYHTNYVFEPRIDAIRRNPDLTREEKSEQIAELERQRDAALQDAYAAIEENVAEMSTTTFQNYSILKKLVESVYNYLSTSPIEIDNIEFWIEKLEQIKAQ